MCCGDNAAAMKGTVFEMEDMINKVKQGAAKAIDGAEKFTKSAVKKTKDVFDKTKYKYTVSEIEDNITAVLAELGRKLYNEYKNGAQFDEQVMQKCEKIDSYYAEIEDIKGKIAQLSNAEVCKSCGEIVSEDFSFCSKCGAKKE